jgi:hypothetical protein
MAMAFPHLTVNSWLISQVSYYAISTIDIAFLLLDTLSLTLFGEYWFMLVFWDGQGLLLIRGTPLVPQCYKLVFEISRIAIILAIIMHTRFSGDYLLVLDWEFRCICYLKSFLTDIQLRHWEERRLCCWIILLSLGYRYVMVGLSG